MNCRAIPQHCLLLSPYADHLQFWSSHHRASSSLRWWPPDSDRDHCLRNYEIRPRPHQTLYAGRSYELRKVYHGHSSSLPQGHVRGCPSTAPRAEGNPHFDRQRLPWLMGDFQDGKELHGYPYWSYYNATALNNELITSTIIWNIRITY